MSDEIQRTSARPLVEKILGWDWEKVALASIVALAVANVIIFWRERKEK